MGRRTPRSDEGHALWSELPEEGAQELEALRSVLAEHATIALDTNVFIYELDENPRYARLTAILFKRILAGSHRAVTSTVMLTELLVKPYRDGSIEKAAFLFDIATKYPHLHWIAPDLEIARLAAEYRAKYRLQTPDAILAATATQAGATCLIGNDAAFQRVPAFRTALLDDFV